MSLLSLLSLPVVVGAFSVTQQTYVAYDTTRRGSPGHKVVAELYLPDDVTEPRPVIAFAHGFNLGADAYPLAKELAARRGYVVFSPHNSGVPSTENLAVDQSFLLAHAVSESASNTSSPLYGRVVPNQTAVMGHSLGGGSSLLAADPAIAAQFPAPAALATVSLGTYTIPGALKASPRIPAQMPALLLTATQDCIDPPEKNSLPVYDALQTQCAAVVSVVGGTHCQYAAADKACLKTEQRCGANPTITREEQLEVALEVLLPYLDAALGDASPAAWDAFFAALDKAAGAGRVNVLARRTAGCAFPVRDLDVGFAEMCQRTVARVASDDSTLRVAEFRANKWRLTITKPTHELDANNITHVKVVTHVENTAPFSHSYIVKMESREGLGLGQNEATCKELHKLSLNTALAALSDDERDAYGVRTKKLIFAEDKQYHTGLYVVNAFLDVAVAENSITLTAPSFLAQAGLPHNWGGKQYCRLIPPAAIHGWIRAQLATGAAALV